MPCFRGTCTARRWFCRPSLRVVLYLLLGWCVMGLLLQVQLFRTAHTTHTRNTKVGGWTSHNNEEQQSMTTMMATVVTKMTKLEQTQHTWYTNMMHKLDTTTAQLVALQQQQQQGPPPPQQQQPYDVEHLTPLLMEEYHDQYTKTEGEKHVIERLQIPSDVLMKNRKVDDNTTTVRASTSTTPTALFTSQDIKSVIKDLIQSWNDLMQNVNNGIQDDANSNNNNITINTNTNTNTIDYFIAMGTLLGQYCYEGFLPNDNDGDVVMIAAHFDRLVRILQETPQLQQQQQQQHTNRSAAAIESNATTTTTTATPANVNNRRRMMIPAHTQLIVRSGLHSNIIAAKYAHIGTGYYIDIALLHPHIDDDHPVVITETGTTSTAASASASASRYYEHQAGSICTNCHTKYVNKKRIVGEQGGALPKFLVVEEQDIYPLNTACRFENMTVSCPHKPLALLQQLYKTPFYSCPRTQKRRTTT